MERPVNLNIVPTDYQGFLRLLIESFGDEGELRKYVSHKTLRELLLFPGFIAVVRPWACTIELENYGFRGGSYRVYDEDWRFQHEVWPENKKFGENYLDIRLLWKVKNGSLLRVFYEGEGDVHGGLLVCQNQLPSRTERYWIRKWDEANKVSLWRPDDHEFLMSTKALPNLGHIRIHYLPGRFTEPKQVGDFYYVEGDQEFGLKEGVEFLDIPVEAVSNWYPKKSGWYLLRHQFAVVLSYHYCQVTPNGINFQYCQKEEFPGSALVVRKVTVCKDLSCKQELEYERNGVRFVRNAPVRFGELTGVGVRRVRYHKDGILYLDLSGSNLAPALPASNIYGVGTPQHAFDTSSWTRLEASLIYALHWQVTDDQEDATLTPNRNWVLSEDEDLVSSAIPPFITTWDEELLDTSRIPRGQTPPEGDHDLVSANIQPRASLVDEDTVHLNQ